MNQKNSKQYKTYLKRCSDDELLRDFYLHTQNKEEIKKQIIESLTINISGDHSLFTGEIRQGVEEVTKKIGEKISRDGVFNPLENFDYIHEKYLQIAEELKLRKPDLFNILTAHEVRNIQEIKLLNGSTKEIRESTERPVTCKYRPTTPLRKLYMGERAINGLKNYGIVTLGQLFDRRKNHNIKNFVGMKNLGKQTYREVQDFLYERGLINE